MENIRESVNANKVYKMGLSGKGIGIAILDTGVCMHKEIEKNVTYFKDFINNR